MYLKVQGSPRLNEAKGLWQSHYYIFATTKKRLTANLLEKIRVYLRQVPITDKIYEERYQKMSLDVFKTFFISQYDTMQENNRTVTLEAEGTTAQLNKDYVTIVNLDDVEG